MSSKEGKRFSIVYEFGPIGGCASCRRPVGFGPIAMDGERPICESCLMQEHPRLGLVMFAVLMVREMGSSKDASDKKIRAMLGFARAFAGECLWPKRATGIVQELLRWEALDEITADFPGAEDDDAAAKD